MNHTDGVVNFSCSVHSVIFQVRTNPSMARKSLGESCRGNKIDSGDQ